MHDPWGGRRRIGFPGGRPSPAVIGGVVVVLFAFLLGRCTAGGGDNSADPTATTTTTILTATTIAIQTTHTVADKETLASIARRYGVTIDAISAANPEVTDINNIFKGQVLKIPAQASATTLAPTTTTTLKKKKG